MSFLYIFYKYPYTLSKRHPERAEKTFRRCRRQQNSHTHVFLLTFALLRRNIFQQPDNTKYNRFTLSILSPLRQNVCRG